MSTANTSPQATDWRRCSSCKKWIPFETLYWVCNVSTCNRKRTGLVFCTVSCWDAHLSLMNHRESWAVEKTSPSRTEWRAAQAKERGARNSGAPAARQRLVRPADRPSQSREVPRETLIVASRLKSYIQARWKMNTSENVLAPLSDIVRRACEEAVVNARRDGRKTVLARDVPEKP